MLQVRRWNLQNCKTSFYANVGHPWLHSLWQRIEDGCPSFRSNEQATGTGLPGRVTTPNRYRVRKTILSKAELFLKKYSFTLKLRIKIIK